MRSRNSLSSRLPAAFAALLVAVLAAGCGSQSYDPAPPRDAPLRTLRFASALSQEESYRVLHARLSQCLHASSYRVQPRFERDTGRAWIMVVQGLGLDRYSFLGNSFAARFEIHATDTGALVEAAISAPELEALAHAAPDWLTRGAQDCG
jgi:hypothetical protein